MRLTKLTETEKIRPCVTCNYEHRACCIIL